MHKQALTFRRRGASIIYLTIITIAILGFISLAVDYGRVQLAKTELQRSADASARAAALALPSGVSASQIAAVTVAGQNNADGLSVVLDTNTDIDFGTWNSTSKTFTVLSGAARSSANAIRVTARRTAARGNAIPLYFGQAIGRPTVDVSAVSIACNLGTPLQLVGVGGVNVMNNFFGGTYSSNTTTDPAHNTTTGGAYAASNAAIVAGNNEQLQAAILGPSGTSNLTTTDPTIRLSQAMSFTLPTASGTSMGNISVSSGTYYVPGGTYFCNDLTIANGCSLIFTGPTTIYFSGNVKFQGDTTIAPSTGKPGDLKIYHTGSGSFGSATANDVDLTADIYAPGCDFAVKNNATLRGRFIFKSIIAKNNLDYYYDTALAATYIGNSGGISTVK